MIKVKNILKIRGIKSAKKKEGDSSICEAENVTKQHTLERPYVLDAKVYKLRSKFAKHSVFVTIGYIKTKEGKVRPFEIFLNSKDLTRAAEFSVLTRLLSAIFRRSDDPTFILEELRSVYDPNGSGYFKNGKYIASFYGELAEVLEEFFKEIGLLKGEDQQNKTDIIQKNEDIVNKNPFQLCPECGMRTLKIENGCYSCVNPDCGYTKCF